MMRVKRVEDEGKVEFNSGAIIRSKTVDEKKV